MRVTTLYTRERRIDALLRQQARVEEARERVSSGRRIQCPSDAPGEIGELLRTRGHVAELTRRRDAADAFLPSMRSAEATLGEISGALREIRTLALQANNAATSEEQRVSLSEQVQRLRERIRDLANAEVGHRYLFAGTATQTAPFAPGPPVTYEGNSDPLKLNLTGDGLFDVSITGDLLLNGRGGADLFQNLEELEAAIRAGDTDGIATALGAVDEDLTNVVRLRGEMGSRTQYVELIREHLTDGITAGRARQSLLEDADLAQAVVEAASAETAHEATLLVVGRMHRTSLLDYLG
jgi:flagellar hook-associated protein 3 FlgL